MKILRIKEKSIKLPAFFPDATHGAVKGVGAKDLVTENVEGIVVNTYHMLIDNNLESIKKHGGIHEFTKFPGIIITDSGGFQVMSLIRKNPENGKITDEGIKFKMDGKIIFLTPKLCIQTQLASGSDIVMCLDDCTDPSESLKEQEKSVERTLVWAERCKNYFDKKTAKRKDKPLLFGIVQGGSSKKLRKKCAEGLTKIGFDGYAYGGWPVDKNKKFLSRIVSYTASLMPDNKPKYAMGVGKPEDIEKCVTYGYNLFDCVLPTRDARHQRLYVFDKNPVSKKIPKIAPKEKSQNKIKYSFLYIGKGKYKNDQNPISQFCRCETCAHYSRSYLYNLFKTSNPLALRLATIHNLRFYTDLMKGFQQ